MKYHEVAIIGSGFFGLRLALFFAKRGKKVSVFEKESEPFMKASLINQARVHNGYHYPRSYPTALSSNKNYSLFFEEYRDCINNKDQHIYAIAKKNSLVNSNQFEIFCKNINSPLKEANSEIKSLFSNDLIDKVYLAEEVVFNATMIKEMLLKQLKCYNVEFFFNTKVNKIQTDDNLVHLITSSDTYRSESLYNLTYGNLNELISNSNFEKIPLKFELTEIALIKPAKNLANLAITVMDGQYFSTMPYPAFNCHSLTHVRYTPHLSWQNKTNDTDSDAELNRKHKTNWEYMFRDVKRYLPIFKNSNYLGSKYAIKAVVSRNEGNDGRPIVVKKHSQKPIILSILGSKFDNIYDLENYLITEKICDK